MMTTILLIIGLLEHAMVEPQKLTIQFEDVRYTEGNFLIGIYLDEASWEKRKPARELVVSKAGLTNGRLSVELPGFLPGKYGLAVLDDANGNEIVDMRWIFPREGFGFSDYYHATLGPPRFKDFVFDFPTKQAVAVKFRYLNF